MREILFRGKRIDNGEWVYGQYVYLLNARAEDGEPIKHMIVDGTPFGQTVNPSTVGQYTGLTDKNGKKIFEGDICKENSGAKSTLVYLGRPELANHVGVVKFGIHQVPSDDPFVWGEAYGFFLEGA